MPYTLANSGKWRREKKLHGRKQIFEEAKGEAGKRQAPSHRSFHFAWTIRPLPNCIISVLAETGSATFVRAVSRRDRPSRPRRCGGHYGEPYSILGIDPKDHARSKISPRQDHITDSFLGRFARRTRFCDAPPLPRNMRGSEKEGPARHYAAGILHRVHLRLQRACARRSLPKLWQRGSVVGSARKRRLLRPRGESLIRVASILPGGFRPNVTEKLWPRRV